MEPAIAIGLVAAIAAIAALIWHQTRTKGRWGFGAWRTKCPRCGTALPMIRKPASSEEMMWGGWTCPRCGCKVDKYGRERTAA
jgi:hypothetical protein